MPEFSVLSLYEKEVSSFEIKLINNDFNNPPNLQ